MASLSSDPAVTGRADWEALGIACVTYETLMSSAGSSSSGSDHRTRDRGAGGLVSVLAFVGCAVPHFSWSCRLSQSRILRSRSRRSRSRLASFSTCVSWACSLSTRQMSQCRRSAGAQLQDGGLNNSRGRPVGPLILLPKQAQLLRAQL